MCRCDDTHTHTDTQTHTHTHTHTHTDTQTHTQTHTHTQTTCREGATDSDAANTFFASDAGFCSSLNRGLTNVDLISPLCRPSRSVTCVNSLSALPRPLEGEGEGKKERKKRKERKK